MTTCKLYIVRFDKQLQYIVAPSIEYLNLVRAGEADYRKRDIQSIETFILTPENFTYFSEKYGWFITNLYRAMTNGRNWLAPHDAERWHELLWLAWKIFIIEDEAWMKKRCEENSKNSSHKN